jgi:hypothetical protein
MRRSSSKFQRREVDREPRDVCILRLICDCFQATCHTVMVNAALQGRQQGNALAQRLDRAQNSQTPCRHVTQINLNASEPPVQAVPLIRKNHKSIRQQSPHECTLSHRSPRGRRSRELNQHAGIRAAIRVALHHDAGCCLARDNGVDSGAGVARGQGFQPLVTQPVIASARRCRLPSDVDDPRQSIAGRQPHNISALRAFSPNPFICGTLERVR